MDMEDFCASSSEHFDNIVASFNLPESTFKQDLPVCAPAVPILPPPRSADKDLAQLYNDISYSELKNAAVTLGNKNSLIDMNWEYLQGQVGTGINALACQNVDTNFAYALNNIVDSLRSEVKTLRSCVYYCVLHLVNQKEKEEREKHKKFEAAQARATHRANKRKAESEVEQRIKTLQPVPLEQVKEEREEKLKQQQPAVVFQQICPIPAKKSKQSKQTPLQPLVEHVERAVHVEEKPKVVQHKKVKQQKVNPEIYQVIQQDPEDLMLKPSLKAKRVSKAKKEKKSKENIE